MIQYHGYTAIKANADLDAIVAAATAGSAAYAVAAAAEAAAAAALAAATAAGNVTTPEAHGALGNGIHDDGPAFRAAAAALGAAGGGRLQTAGKPYLLATADPTPLSTDEYVAFYLPSKVSICGGGTLKVSNALQNVIPAPLASRVNVIGCASGTRGQYIGDLTFDYSLVTPTKAFCSFHAVLSAAWHVTMERLNITNCPGRQMIMTESSARHGGGATAGSAFNTIRNVTILNGSKNANAVQTDCAMVYLEGDHHTVDDCDFSNAIAAITNCSMVEMHGSYQTVKNSRFLNAFPAIYPGVATASGTVCYKPTIEGNTFKDCNGGIVFFDYITAGKILNNTFENCVGTAGFRAISGQRNNLTGADQGPLVGLQIKGNTFWGDPLGTPTIELSGIQDGILSENTFEGENYPINLILALTEMKNVQVTNNHFIDPPDSVFEAGQVNITGDVGGAWVGKFTDILINDNLFEKNRTGAPAANASALSTTNAGGGATVAGLQFFRNTVVNFAGAAIVGAFASNVATDTTASLVSYAPVWSQSSGVQPAIGDGSIVGSYVKGLNECRLRFRLTVGAATTFGNGAVAYQFSLPFPINAAVDMHDPGAVNVLDVSALVDYPGQIAGAAGTSVVSLQNKGQLVRDAFPIAWAVGDIIDVSFSYPI